MTRPQAILTDIEGITSSISFVKDVLFPYARRAMPATTGRNTAVVAVLLVKALTPATLPSSPLRVPVALRERRASAAPTRSASWPGRA